VRVANPAAVAGNVVIPAVFVTSVDVRAELMRSAVVIMVTGSAIVIGLADVEKSVALLLQKAVCVLGTPDTSAVAGIAGGKLAGAMLVIDAFETIAMIAVLGIAVELLFTIGVAAATANAISSDADVLLLAGAIRVGYALDARARMAERLGFAAVRLCVADFPIGHANTVDREGALLGFVQAGFLDVTQLAAFAQHLAGQTREIQPHLVGALFVLGALRVIDTLALGSLHAKPG